MSERGLAVTGLVVARGGREVLHGVDLLVRPGEITALLGANGAGKSTLVSAVAALLPIERGTVRIDGTPCGKLSPDGVRRRGLAVVPEGHRVLGDLSVEDNLKVAGLALGPAAMRTELERIAVLFPELGRHRRSAASALSGGQKQMVSVAQALLARPRYLIVDELSLGLAPAVVGRLAAVLGDVAAGGVGVLLIEQFTTLALTLARSAYVMERGRIVFGGPSASLQADRDILRSAYLGG